MTSLQMTVKSTPAACEQQRRHDGVLARVALARVAEQQERGVVALAAPDDEVRVEPLLDRPPAGLARPRRPARGRPGRRGSGRSGRCGPPTASRAAATSSAWRRPARPRATRPGRRSPASRHLPRSRATRRARPRRSFREPAAGACPVRHETFRSEASHGPGEPGITVGHRQTASDAAPERRTACERPAQARRHGRHRPARRRGVRVPRQRRERRPLPPAADGDHALAARRRGRRDGLLEHGPRVGPQVPPRVPHHGVRAPAADPLDRAHACAGVRRRGRL